ncbi:hypothetical protein ACFE04_017311 [Oxalis oulophora]
MGCTVSKLDNEDTVRRCKERRRLIKEAVHARHHLAAAHADYCRSLRLTGSALVSFAAGEPLSVSDQSPPVFLHSTTTPSFPKTNHIPPRVPPSPTTTTSSGNGNGNGNGKLPQPHILSSSSAVESPDVPSKRRRNGRKPKPPLPSVKLPHILSESSLNSSPVSRHRWDYPTAFQANSTYTSTPSQTSSVWNWENFYPPSPPDSEFFEQRTRNVHHHQQQPHNHHLDHEEEEEEESSSGTETEAETEYDFFKSNAKQRLHQIEGVGGGMKHNREEETEREEVQCSEWGDHYSTTTSSDEEEGGLDTRSEIGTRSNYGSESFRSESIRQQQHQQQQPIQQQPLKRVPEKLSEDDGRSSSKSSYSYKYKTGGEISMDDDNNMKMVVRHKDLKEIVDALKDYFDKAAAAGDQVSEMLEIGRAQLDKSFRQLKKTVYHSSSVLSSLSSTWTSIPPLAVRYRLDTGSLEEPGGSKSLCSTLERLLAWEKKLYEEVKAREGVKIEHEKKLATLQSQEYKGEDETKLDKTKASITRLQSLIIVTSQAVSTTSTAIVGLRDSGLIPQLVELCHGFMYMWKSMHQYHEVQNNIVQQVRGLINRSTKGESTSELHKQATRDLESAVSSWHSSFCRLIKFQRDFIQYLHGWFKLTLIPVGNDNLNGNRDPPSEVYMFCDEWKLALERVPDTVASEAIKSFINVVHVISVKQSEELKIRKRTETASKELEKKASSLRNIERKYYHSYSMVGIGLPDNGLDNGQVLDARDPLVEKKSELAACQRRVEDEMLRHAKAVEVTRAMTLNNLQTGLPGVFQALTSFSSLFTESLESVCTRSYAIK